MALRHITLAFLILLGAAAHVSAQPGTPEALKKAGQALQLGETDKAASIFREALTRRPKDPQLLFGAGVVAKLQGREPEAIAFLKQALLVNPQIAEAALLLGELLYRQGEVDLAIKTYERALPKAPGSVTEAMRRRLDAWREEALLPQNHEAIKDERFTVSFDGPAQQQLAARATSVLNAAFWRIGKTLGAYPSSAINVVLYSERQFHDITGAPEWAAGGFDGQIRMPVHGAARNLGEFDRVLIHELTHAMLKNVASRNLPAWLNEGLAMYCEGHDGVLAQRRLAAARLFVPLAALRTSFGRLNAAQATIAYEESAYAARALLDRIGPSGLGQLLQDLSAGQTMEEAIERFGITFTAFESDLERRVIAAPR